jgi:putative hydrolase of the HAD superfamily
MSRGRPKALLFDIDGVLLYHHNWYVEEVARGLPAGAFDILAEFHEGPANIRCDRGEADPLAEIAPFLARAGWGKGIDEYFRAQYDFEKGGIDFRLLGAIREMKGGAAKCFIGSNQNRHRKAFLMEEMRLGNTFEEAYFSCDFGYVKPERGYWDCAFRRMAGRISGLEPDEVLFLDDRIENVESSMEYGFKAIHVKGREDVERALGDAAG